jgi:hypothetical protein
MIIITGASDNHYASLVKFIYSFIQHNYTNNTLIVYDLGIEEEKWEKFKLKCKSVPTISFRKFEYDRYPSWYDIKINAGEYAWKPAIIYNTFIQNPGQKLLWMDSGNLIQDNLAELDQFLESNGVYSALSSGTISRWTHKKTIDYLKCSWDDELMRNAACIGFDTKNPLAEKLLVDYYECCKTKDCISPKGSNRDNHRQDQSVFSILFYKHLREKHIMFCNHFLGYSIHNDVDLR